MNEALIKVRPLEEIGGGEMQQGVEDDPFRYMRDEEVVATQGHLEEDMEKIYDGWNRLRVNSSTRVTSDQFPLLHRNAWLELFIKYNTPLPSSAAVEMLFSIGSDILRPKRSTLTADNFEKLVFIKGNLQLLDETSILASLELGDETPDADE